MSGEKEDVFRQVYSPVTQETSEYILKVKEKAQELYDLIQDAMTPNNGREISVAKTELETSIMWAVKGLTK